MFKIISRNIEEITVEKAYELLNINAFEGQRNIKGEHLKNLTEKILNGEFRTGEIAIAELSTKQKYLINGQHQCHAVINSQHSIKALVENYSAETLSDLSELFRQFDCNPPRTVGDMTRVEANALNLDWSLRISRLVVAAIYINEKRVKNHHYMASFKKVESLKNYLKEGTFINFVLGENKVHCKFLMRAAVAAIMIQTFQKCQSDAENFWLSIRDGEHLTKSMPAYKLREFLQHTNHPKGMNQFSYRTAGDNEIQYRCILAWNAFRRGKSTDLKYFAGKPLPKIV